MPGRGDVAAKPLELFPLPGPTGGIGMERESPEASAALPSQFGLFIEAFPQTPQLPDLLPSAFPQGDLLLDGCGHAGGQYLLLIGVGTRRQGFLLQISLPHAAKRRGGNYFAWGQQPLRVSRCQYVKFGSGWGRKRGVDISTAPMSLRAVEEIYSALKSARKITTIRRVTRVNADAFDANRFAINIFSGVKTLKSKPVLLSTTTYQRDRETDQKHAKN